MLRESIVEIHRRIHEPIAAATGLPNERYTSELRSLSDDEQRRRFVSNPASCQSQLTVESNWKLAVENYLESYHLPTVHPASLGRQLPADQFIN